MTSQPSGELGPSEPSLMDIAAEMDEQPGEAVETDELEEEEQERDEADEEPEEEDSEDSEDEAEEEPDPDADPEFDVSGAKVKLSELKAGYMKDADYRRKTAEVAETKRAAEAFNQEVRQQREYLAKQAAPLLHLMREQLIGSQAELAKLAHEDPAAWVAENQRFQQRAQYFEALIAENDRLASQHKADTEREERDLAAKEREILREKLTEWHDPKVAEAEQTKIAQYLIGLGYQQEELAMLTDHRALLAVRNAMKWDEHQKALAKAKAKQGQPEPPARVVKPGAAKIPPTQKQRRVAEASRRLNSNPNDLKALAAFTREAGF